ncbi:MAG: nucleoside triphosphate pyrophosphohydrolase family protein [Colwellia sp.]|nr:nucleoside triphosphate pyrophosphohydrolase family protein [Colwellia sp.]
MDINEYQANAVGTQQFDSKTEQGITIALLGLSGEVGELLTEYKKKMRDGESYNMFRDKVIEEMGDIMWYLSSIAAYEDIEFSEILKRNLDKVDDRWHDINSLGQFPFEHSYLDDDCIEKERFPREFVLEFKEEVDENNDEKVIISVNGRQFGDHLKDNSYDPDFYRYHDIFHFSYVVILGWSPVVRGFFGCKRKKDYKRDEVEDGGRAIAIDEAISVLIFEYARNHNFFKDIGGVDYDLLRTIKLLTKNLEVKKCTLKQWEQAILLGFDIWHKLKEKRTGRVVCSMQDRSMIFEDVKTLKPA